MKKQLPAKQTKQNNLLAHLLHTKQEQIVITLIIGAAVIFRFYQLDYLPRGLNADEVFNGIDALRIGREGWPVFFPGNNGREALFIYLIAASLRTMGQTVIALRLPAALLGTGTVWLTWQLGRNLFNRQVGLLAAALVAVSLWPVMESRWALRAVSLTFMTAVTAYLLDRAFRRHSTGHWLAGGAALGLTLYTYIPSRLMPLVILCWMGWLFWTQPERAKSQWRQMVLAWLVGLFVFLPFARYIWLFPDKVNQRINGLTVALDLALQQGQWAALAESVGGVLRMFSLRGDTDWRYHVAGVPVFDPLTSVFFYVGVWLSVWLAFSHKAGQKRPSYALLLLWGGAMLVPNAILEANSSFLRAAGAIVPIYLMAAIGLDWTITQLKNRFPQIIHARTVTAVLLAGFLATAALTYHYYVNIWNNQAEARHIYHAYLGEMANFINQNPPPENVRVYIADRYVADMAPRTFAFHSTFSVQWFAVDTTLALGNGSMPLWIFIGSNETMPAELIQKAGLDNEEIHTFANGDPAFTIYRLPPETNQQQPQQPLNATFAANLRLIGYDWSSELFPGETVPLFLYWEIPPNHSEQANQLIFIKTQLLDSSGNVWGEAENLIGYPQESWQTGDRFIQLLPFTIPNGIPPGEAKLRFLLRDFNGEPIPVTGNNDSTTFLIRSGRPLTDFTLTPEMPLFDGTLTVHDATFSSQFTPGLPIDISVEWVALQQPNLDYLAQFQLWYAGEESPVWTQTEALWPDVYPPTQWQPGEAVRTLHRLFVPADLPLGSNPEMRVQLLNPTTNTAVPLTQGSNLLAKMTLVARAHSYEVPPISHPLEANFGETIRLLGYDLAAESVQSGHPLRLTLYWQAQQIPSGHYTVFTHVITPDGRIVAQKDSLPGDSWTGTWLPGEVITDEREILVGTDVENGRYLLRIGLYNGGTGERLPVTFAGETQPDNQLILTEITVTK
ncbi:MAG: hypothetical protein Kow0080_07330 [Candidatus Promineifilaceae bacterium]